MWIFGYGSLIWNPNFAYHAHRLARIDNWVRRFWQGSIDHRGVPGHPGRVVTLVSEPSGNCWGVAFNCGKSDNQQVIEDLDLREKGGYHRESVTLNFTDGSTTQGLVYVADPDNLDYLGPADEIDIARQILSAEGPSGSNREYLSNLASALRTLDVSDSHVFLIESKVQTLINTRPSASDLL